ncbi:MAG: hypothetical protein QMC23_11240 [Rubritalea sp.]|jgi:hypothetical protein
MKGSPILASALVCLIMLSMYVGMRVAFSEDDTAIVEPRVTEVTASEQISVYAEIYFSSQPKNFSLIHPATGKTLIKVENIDDAEWSGDIFIPVEKLTSTISKEIEIQGAAEWQSSEASYHFMQVIISPDELDPQTRTLRAAGDIKDIMNFHWKENE